MKNIFGNSLTMTIFGESHGPAVGCVLDGLTPGIAVDEEEIRKALERRRPDPKLDTARVEPDHFEILSGVFAGKTTGTPLTIVIRNENARSRDYVYGPARPSHADYTGFLKYHGYEDYRGGGHFSGRVTAAVAAAGGILIPALRALGITVGTHIKECGTVTDRAFSGPEDVELLLDRRFPVLSPEAGQKMEEEIRNAKAAGDSIGGITETAVFGLPGGLGEPFFDSVEGLLSHAAFSLGGVKGVSFGEGFGFSALRGSEANDALRLMEGKIITKTNRNGGINGGITNGMPVLMNCAVKPTPSIATAQETVDFVRMEETETSVQGRHDPAIVRRICPVLSGMTALVIADLLIMRYGEDVLAKGIRA
ncbi:MAG: chorismate synthase [Lachnospiraceae bacterium]|nr:chorismate synthase [Lachnospiraceae bacterium]